MLAPLMHAAPQPDVTISKQIAPMAWPVQQIRVTPIADAFSLQFPVTTIMRAPMTLVATAPAALTLLLPAMTTTCALRILAAAQVDVFSQIFQRLVMTITCAPQIVAVPQVAVCINLSTATMVSHAP